MLEFVNICYMSIMTSSSSGTSSGSKSTCLFFSSGCSSLLESFSLLESSPWLKSLLSTHLSLSWTTLSYSTCFLFFWQKEFYISELIRICIKEIALFEAFSLDSFHWFYVNSRTISSSIDIIDLSDLILVL